MPMLAIVARSAPVAMEFLQARGPEQRWVKTPADATVFCNMREATRVALHLPRQLRAYAWPVR